jgi:hypothetical protein
MMVRRGRGDESRIEFRITVHTEDL